MISQRITRRKALAAGTLINLSDSTNAQNKSLKKSTLPFLTPWSPPVDLKRELTPGTTPVRLACSAYLKLVIKAAESAERVGASTVTVGLGSRSRLGTICPHKDNWTFNTC